MLLEVDLAAHPAKVCDESYSRLFDYKQKFPEGINSNVTLCIGDPRRRGNGACQVSFISSIIA